MFQKQLPADELAQVRRKIRDLRAREVALRKCFTEDVDDGVYEGCDYDVVVRLQKQCVLNKSRLPDEILNDPQYFDIRYAPNVRVVPRAEPRLPLDDLPSGILATGDSFDVIEAFT